MTTINSQEDFLRALKDNPEWMAAVRAQILGEELLQLPAKFDAFVQQMTESVAEQQVTNAELKQSVAELKEINKRITASLESIDGRVFSLEQNVARLTDDVGWLKGKVVLDLAVDDAAVIALGMGMEYVRRVPREELYRLAMKAAQGEALSAELRSFRQADLVIEATDGTDNQYIAVEASFVGGAYDVLRALRNAELLTEYTGVPTRAAIASVSINEAIDWQVSSGAVYWHEIEEVGLRPD